MASPPAAAATADAAAAVDGHAAGAADAGADAVTESAADVPAESGPVRAEEPAADTATATESGPVRAEADTDTDTGTAAVTEQYTADYTDLCLTLLFDSRVLGSTQEARWVSLLRDHAWVPAQLAVALDRQRTRPSGQALGPAAHAALARVLNAALEACERTGDYRSAKTLMHMSCTFYCERGPGNVNGGSGGGDNARDFVHRLIERRPLFADRDFWRDVFFDTMHQARTLSGISGGEGGPLWSEMDDEQRESHAAADQLVAFSQLSTFAFFMIQFGVAPPDAATFVADMAEVHAIPEDMIAPLVAQLDVFAAAADGGASEEQSAAARTKDAWRRERRESWSRRRQRQQRAREITDAEPEPVWRPGAEPSAQPAPVSRVERARAHHSGAGGAPGGVASGGRRGLIQGVTRIPAAAVQPVRATPREDPRPAARPQPSAEHMKDVSRERQRRRNEAERTARRALRAQVARALMDRLLTAGDASSSGDGSGDDQ